MANSRSLYFLAFSERKPHQSCHHIDHQNLPPKEDIKKLERRINKENENNIKALTELQNKKQKLQRIFPWN